VKFHNQGRDLTQIPKYDHLEALYESSLNTRILPFGDSLTASLGTDINPYRYYLWHLLKGQSFEFVGDFTDPDSGNYADTDFDQHHSGFGGEQAHELRDRVSLQVNKHNPDIMLLQVGTNDANSSKDPYTYQSELETLIDLAREIQPTLNIVIAEVPPQIDRNASNKEIVTFNDRIRETCTKKHNKFSSVVLADIYNDFSFDYPFPQSGASSASSPYLQSDGIHFTSSGGEYVANGFYEALNFLNLVTNKSVDEDAKEYFNEILHSGSFINSGQRKAITHFVNHTKTDGTWSKFIDVMPFAGDALQAAEVRLKYPSSFTNRVLKRTHESSPFNFDTNKGVEYGNNKNEPNSSVRGFNLEYSPNDIGDLASHAIYIGQPRPASGTVFIGAYESSSARSWLFDWTDGYITGSWKSAEYPTKQGQAPGLWLINRQQQDSTRLYYNGNYLVEEISNTINSVPTNIHVGHNWGESSLYPAETALGFALIADPMTDTEVDQASTQVLQLMNKLGRSTPLDDGLVGWWRMDSSASIQRNGYNDVTVNTLPNKQGSAGDMQVATTAPEYVPRLKDERDMLASNAEGQALQVSSLSPGDEFTIIVFCATKANSTTILDTPDWRIQWGWSGGVNLYDKPADTYGGNASASSAKYNVIALRVKASEHDFFFNGNFGTVESNTANLAGFSQMWLGNNSQTDTKGSIYGECLLYNRALTDEELNDEYDRMEPFWGGLDEST
jgi:lysophospholipase L1-like esterase